MTPRQLVFSLLQKAEKNRQFSNLVLDHALSESGLSASDRALAATIFYGVIERKLTLDYQISHLSSRPVGELDSDVLTALRMGLYQLMYMDRIPPHAVLHESVALCFKRGGGFVNAVLRAYTREPRLRLPDREKSLTEYLSVAYSVGLPLTEKLLSVYGENTEALLDSFCRPVPTTIRVNTLRSDRETMMQKIPGAIPTPYAPTGLRVKGAVRELYGFSDGLFFVQDEASQICVEALDAKEGECVADICACPGSKSFGTAMHMNNRGTLYAFDLHEKKLSLIRSGADRLDIRIISCAARDGRVPLPALVEACDRVLCDVPCSGFGVLAKKPELRYKDPKESKDLPDIQLAILENACHYVKKGGVLVYSTCTVFPEENENNVLRFLERHPEFTLTPFSVGDLAAETGMRTILPSREGTDGFFIAKLTRN